MRVASLAPVAVGLVRLQSAPAVVVAKVTYAVESGCAVLLPDPKPISGDLWSETGELRYASDLTAAKEGVDLLIVGHAKAAQPRTEIDVTATLGDFRLSATARSDTAQHRIPLNRLFCGAVPVHTAPVRSARSANVAYAAHRLERYGGGVLSLGGLIGDGGQLDVRMPRDEPSVAVGSQTDVATMTNIPLVCDTIWIDADEAEIQLVFRGALPTQPLADPYLVVTLGAPTEVPPYDLLMRFPKLAAWTEATETNSASRTMPVEDEPLDDEDLSCTAILDDVTLRSRADDLLVAADGVTTMVLQDDEEVNAARRALQNAADDERTQVMTRERGPESTRLAPPGSQRLSAPERRALEEAGTMVGRVGESPPPSSPGSFEELPVLSMLAYASLVAQLEHSTNPAYLLRQHHLSTDAWSSQQRAWNRLSRDDPKVARALRRALARARSQTS